MVGEGIFTTRADYGDGGDDPSFLLPAVEYGANQFSPFARNTTRCGLRCVVNDERGGVMV